MSLDLDNIYKYHTPIKDQAARYQLIRKTAHVLANVIEESCPDSRERNIAFTSLEAAAMWANASIARNEI